MSKTVQQVVLVIDEAIKERAKIALRANGISLKDGADDLMRRIVESSRLPFRIDRDPKLHNAGITRPCAGSSRLTRSGRTCQRVT